MTDIVAQNGVELWLASYSGLSACVTNLASYFNDHLGCWDQYTVL